MSHIRRATVKKQPPCQPKSAIADTPVKHTETIDRQVLPRFSASCATNAGIVPYWDNSSQLCDSGRARQGDGGRPPNPRSKEGLARQGDGGRPPNPRGSPRTPVAAPRTPRQPPNPRGSLAACVPPSFGWHGAGGSVHAHSCAGSVPLHTRTGRRGTPLQKP